MKFVSEGIIKMSHLVWVMYASQRLSNLGCKSQIKLSLILSEQKKKKQLKPTEDKVLPVKTISRRKATCIISAASVSLCLSHTVMCPLVWAEQGWAEQVISVTDWNKKPSPQWTTWTHLIGLQRRGTYQAWTGLSRQVRLMINYQIIKPIVKGSWGGFISLKGKIKCILGVSLCIRVDATHGNLKFS